MNNKIVKEELVNQIDFIIIFKLLHSRINKLKKKLCKNKLFYLFFYIYIKIHIT